MRKNILVILILVVIVSLVFSSNTYAEYEGDDYIYFGTIEKVSVIDADKIPYATSPLNKLNRGLINGASFWTELPAEVAKVSKEQNPAMGATVGVVQGTITGVVRGATALFDTFTFFIPPYDKPVMKPEYALNRCDDKMKELF
ncbi:MAG: exosortase system-associated protein, TIGR04073 family [Candidatus Omnitrophica bacterium]|nr:exosortase system-associated protein, TIGR04073 family [Candidatus Omnitrophota bacterium]